jgi:hypothetical protein
MENLPVSVFSLIRDFVFSISIESQYDDDSFREGCSDWRSLLNCNKSWMYEVKQH